VIQLTDEQTERYESLKQRAGSETVDLVQNLEKKKRELKIEEDNLHEREDELQKGNKDMADLAEEINLINERVRKLNTLMSEYSQKNEGLTDELKKIRDEKETALEQQQKLTVELRELNLKIHEAKSDIEESSRRKNFKELATRLKNLFPGVHGLISDLATPKTKYDKAFTIAVAKQLDSFVVEDENTAFQCIEYLKEQRSFTATFIPLGTIKSNPIDERLRSLGDNVYPLIDVITFDKKYVRAMQYVCGETLVVDTLEIARQIAFESSKRRRVVTLDGSLINKSGLMTGGVSRKTRERDNQPIGEWKSQRDVKSQRITELGHIIRSHAREKQLEYEISQLEMKQTSNTFDLDLSNKRLAKAKEDYDQLADRTNELQTKYIDIFITNIKEKKKEIENDENDIKYKEDKIFNTFQDEVGDIREYEKRIRERNDTKTKVLTQITAQKSRLINILEYENSRNFDKLIEDLEEIITKEEEQLSKIIEDNKKLSKNISDEEKGLKKTYRRFKEK